MSSTDQDGSTQQNRTIAVKFTSNKDGANFYCTVKRNVPFRKIMQTYYQYYGLEDNSVCFLYDGAKLLPNLTPQDVNFPDGGEIDVMSQVHGGGCAR